MPTDKRSRYEAMRLSCLPLIGSKVDIAYYPKSVNKNRIKNICCKILGCYPHLILFEVDGELNRARKHRICFNYDDFIIGHARSKDKRIEEAIRNAWKLCVA